MVNGVFLIVKPEKYIINENLKDNSNISYFFFKIYRLMVKIFHVYNKIYWDGVWVKNPILSISIKNSAFRKILTGLPLQLPFKLPFLLYNIYNDY